MDYLYLLLNIGSISIPFFASFHPRLKFYKKWKSLFIAIIISSSFYITWDVIFTQRGVWGFNPAYYLEYTIAGLPIEEWLFFICIPYACVFMHYALLELFPKLKFPDQYINIKVRSLQMLLLLISVIFFDRSYTVVNFSYAVVLLEIAIRFQKEILQQFLVTFIAMLVPFFIVNGVLTGAWIVDEVVWYNDNENLGVRLGTIPIEDSIYAFTMILTNLLLLTYFENRKIKSSRQEH